MAEPVSEPALADDVLEGAAAISAFLFGAEASPRRAYRLLASRRVPCWRLGNRYYARRTRLMRWIVEQEDAALR